MNIKKFFCCVPSIISVSRTFPPLLLDKATQHNADELFPQILGNHGNTKLTPVTESYHGNPAESDSEVLEQAVVYQNATFVERESLGGSISLGSSLSRAGEEMKGRLAEEGDEEGEEERGECKPKEVSYHDILINNMNDSVSSINTLNSTYSTPVPKTHAIDTSSVIEAHGLLTTLLMENDLPQHVTETLRRVAKILDPSPTTSGPMLARMLSKSNQLKMDSEPSSDCDDDDGDKPNWRSRYNGPSKRRLKVSVWSTVTSATGLPTLVPEPSTSFKKAERGLVPPKTRSGKDHDGDSEASLEMESSYVTPWDRRMSRTVQYKLHHGKDPTSSILTDSEKQYLSRPLSDEYECTSVYLREAESWAFPIFKFNNSTEHCLSLLAFHIFSKTKLIDSFRINPVHFRNFFEKIEQGYHDLPYHNAIHAADVLQAVYYLCTQKIPGFNHTVSDDNYSDGEDLSSGTTTMGERSMSLTESYGYLKDIMTDLELLALFTAAAIHDYDHPGRTNAFLVATGDTKAIMYNDRSVLESHHVASAWYLLVSDERYNFLSGLSASEFKRFRFLLIEAVLATDLKKHFEFLGTLNSKAVEGMDWSSAEDRILALQMCIKLADINAPCKEYDLHIQWTKRIVEEFYQQGDSESELGIPVSQYMDRQKDPPRVPELQLNFIKHLVAPLYHSMANSCLVPGAWVEIDQDGPSGAENSGSTSDLNSAKPNIMPHTHKFESVLQKNLDANYAVWKERNEVYQSALKKEAQSNGIKEEEEEGAKKKKRSNSKLGYFKPFRRRT